MAVFVGRPSCGVKLNVPENFLGKKVRCASCSTVFEAKEDAVPPPRASDAMLKESVREELPPAPLDEPPPKKKKRDWGDDDRDRDRDRDEDREPRDEASEAFGEYDDRYDKEEKRRRRKRRRDLAPHRGGMILGMGIGSIVLGTFGLCCCNFIGLVGIGLGATSWIMGQGDLRQMDDGVMDSDGRGNTQAGYICGIVGCVLGVMDLVCFVLSMFLNFAPLMMGPRGGGGF